MNKQKWANQENLEILALKLNEEAGEVAKAVIDAPLRLDDASRGEIREEVDHVIFIAERLRSVLDV